MKQNFLILSIFVFKLSYCQVDNFDLLTKNIDGTNIKSITKYLEWKGYPNGEKRFKLEFNKQGQLLSIEQYEYPMGPDNPGVMRQEIEYDKTGKKIATLIIAPDGSIAVDTLIFNDKGDLIQRQRIVNGETVKTWDYPTKQKVEDTKEFDNRGNLIKSTESDESYTIYEYDKTGNLTKETQFQDGKEHTRNTYQYDKNGRLIELKVYLLYINDGANAPLTYYFEYEYFE
jgi:YD repeat-containing protein